MPSWCLVNWLIEEEDEIRASTEPLDFVWISGILSQDKSPLKFLSHTLLSLRMVPSSVSKDRDG